jgi:hypothetical protein
MYEILIPRESDTKDNLKKYLEERLDPAIELTEELYKIVNKNKHAFTTIKSESIKFQLTQYKKLRKEIEKRMKELGK